MNIIKSITSLFKKKEECPAVVKTAANASFSYDVLEKSKTRSEGEYHYKAFIAFEGTFEETKLSSIANKIQQDLGQHPMAYHNYDLEFKHISDSVIELTWKSWDSCD